MRGKLGWVAFVLGCALVVFAILRGLGTIPVSASSLGTTLACPSPIHYVTTPYASSPPRGCVSPIDNAIIEAVGAFGVGIALIVVGMTVGFRTINQ